MSPSRTERPPRRPAVRPRRRPLATTVMLVVAAVIAGLVTQADSRHRPPALASTAIPPPRTLTATSVHSRGGDDTDSHRNPTAQHQRGGSQRTPAGSAARPSGCPLDLAGARRVARAEQSAGYRIGFALTSSDRRTLADVSANTRNYGASITKAMLLVAYLQDHPGTVSRDARAQLTTMIEVSDNTAADWVYDHLKSGRGDVERVAFDAGMTGFHLSVSDPVYTLGQSLISARDFAGLFAGIQSLMPARERRFGMSLLAGVQEHVGLLAAGLPGVVYSKEGWKPEPAGILGAPYIVDQAAQFTCGGVRYGLAVTVGHASDQSSGETVVQHIASALLR